MLWRICLALGRLYQRQAREVDAEQAFSTARAMIEHLAASVPDERLRQQFLSQTAQQLPQRRSPTPGRTVRQTRGGLTEREVEVLRLVAQGMTDAQVAEQLVISPRTVNGHLRSIYSKIAVTSRSAATRYAVDHHLV